LEFSKGGGAPHPCSPPPPSPCQAEPTQPSKTFPTRQSSPDQATPIGSRQRQAEKLRFSQFQKYRAKQITVKTVFFFSVEPYKL